MKSINITTYVLLFFAATCLTVSASDTKSVNPDQLTELLAKADRIVVTDNNPGNEPEILFESRKREDLDALSTASVVKIPETGFACMCAGTPAIYIYKGEELLAKLTNHHGVSIRCSLWSSDAHLTDQESWLRWFDKRGIKQPRQEVERRNKIREQRKNNK